MVRSSSSFDNCLNVIKQKLFNQQNYVRNVFSKPLNRENLFYHYTPVAASISYSTLSLHLIEPSILPSIINLHCRPCSTTELFLLSTLGFSVEMYKKNILPAETKTQKVFQSAYYSGLFVLGSMVFWKLMSLNLPNSKLLKTGVALMSSITMLRMTLHTLNDLQHRTGRTLGSAKNWALTTSYERKPSILTAHLLKPV